MVEGTEQIEGSETWVNEWQVPQFFKAFAKKYRLKIHRDVYGDPIIPGIWGQFFVYGDNQIGVSLVNRFMALWKNRLMSHQSPSVVVVCEAETEVNLFCSPEDDAFIQEAIKALDVRQGRNLSDERRAQHSHSARRWGLGKNNRATQPAAEKATTSAQ